MGATRSERLMSIVILLLGYFAIRSGTNAISQESQPLDAIQCRRRGDRTGRRREEAVHPCRRSAAGRRHATHAGIRSGNGDHWEAESSSATEADVTPAANARFSSYALYFLSRLALQWDTVRCSACGIDRPTCL